MQSALKTTLHPEVHTPARPWGRGALPHGHSCSCGAVARVPSTRLGQLGPDAGDPAARRQATRWVSTACTCWWNRSSSPKSAPSSSSSPFSASRTTEDCFTVLMATSWMGQGPRCASPRGLAARSGCSARAPPQDPAHALGVVWAAQGTPRRDPSTRTEAAPTLRPGTHLPISVDQDGTGALASAPAALALPHER